jgi:hypothetical protein
MDQVLSNLSLLTEFPIVNLKIILDGLMVGALFALAAYGLALVWGVMNVKNLAQGDFVISGGTFPGGRCSMEFLPCSVCHSLSSSCGASAGSPTNL